MLLLLDKGRDPLSILVAEGKPGDSVGDPAIHFPSELYIGGCSAEAVQPWLAASVERELRR